MKFYQEKVDSNMLSSQRILSSLNKIELDIPLHRFLCHCLAQFFPFLEYIKIPVEKYKCPVTILHLSYYYKEDAVICLIPFSIFIFNIQRTIAKINFLLITHFGIGLFKPQGVITRDRDENLPKKILDPVVLLTFCKRDFCASTL